MAAAAVSGAGTSYDAAHSEVAGSQRATRAELQKQVNELQQQYFAAGGGNDCWSDMAADFVDRSMPTPAERALGKLAGARAPSVYAQRNASVLQKDGLDLSFQHLQEDASRMRTTMTELTIAFDEPRRQRQEQRLSEVAIPTALQRDLRDSGRLIAEQRHVLGQLKHERQLAETHQMAFGRDNRRAWEGHGPPGAGPPMQPADLSAAQSQLRASDLPLEVSRLAGPSQDGHVLAEFTGVVGFTVEQVRHAEYSVSVLDQGGAVLTSNTCGGPLDIDGTPKARRLKVALPGDGNLEGASVELALRGIDGAAACRVPLAEIGEGKAAPRNLEVQVSGEWDVRGYWRARDSAFFLEVSLSALRPPQPGNFFAHTRLVEDGPRSAFPGLEMPPSQAHLRQQFASWDERGRPDIHAEIDAREVEAIVSGRFEGHEAFRGSFGRGDNERGSSGAGLPWADQFGHSNDTGPQPGSMLPPPACEPPSIAGVASNAAFLAGFEERAGALASGHVMAADGLEADAVARPGQAWDGPTRYGAPRAAPAHADGARASCERRGGDPVHSRFPAAAPAFATESTENAAAGGRPRAEFQAAAPFAAFAGFGAEDPAPPLPGATDGVPVRPKGPVDLADGLHLRPPDASESLERLFAELRGAAQLGRLGQPEVAQSVVDFAAKAAQPGALEDAALDEEQASSYAALLLDAMERYPASALLNLWLVQALMAIYGSEALSEHRAQFAVPLFTAFVAAALRLAAEPDPVFHRHVFAGLALVATPDCNIDTSSLVGYICDRLDDRQGRMAPLMAEHALAVLGVARSPHRLADQIRHALRVLRAPRSDAHLLTRALVTVAELYTVLGEERARALRSSEASSALEPAAQDALVSGTAASGPAVPDSLGCAAEVRLVTTALDLYPGHRKIGGAALRACAAMSRVSDEHLRAVLVDDLNSLVKAQRHHEDSRSVALHIAEIVCLGARAQMQAVSSAVLQLLARALHSATRDPDVVANAVEALQLAAATDELLFPVVEVVSGAELTALGDLHRADPGIAASLCELLASLASTGREMREHLVEAGALSVPFAALQEAGGDAQVALAACRCAKRLLCGSKSAAKQAVRLSSAAMLFNALMSHAENPKVVRKLLAALAVCTQNAASKKQLLDHTAPRTWSVLDALLRVAEETSELDPDVLAWTCCALGVLTASEIQDAQEALRLRIDVGLLEGLVRRVADAFPRFQTGWSYCQHLIADAQHSDLRADRLLRPDGALAHALRSRFGRAAASLDEAEAQACRAARVAWEARQAGRASDDAVDVFGPLRALGVGETAADLAPEADFFGGCEVGGVKPGAATGGAEGAAAGAAEDPGAVGWLIGGSEQDAAGGDTAGVAEVADAAEASSRAVRRSIAVRAPSTTEQADFVGGRSGSVKAGAAEVDARGAVAGSAGERSSLAWLFGGTAPDAASGDVGGSSAAAGQAPSTPRRKKKSKSPRRAHKTPTTPPPGRSEP